MSKKSFLLTITGSAAIAISALTGCGQVENGLSQAISSSGTSNVTATQSTSNHGQPVAKVINLNMTISPDGPKYIPANATLPTNALVHVTIHDEDNGPASVPDFFARVKGTYGGTETVNGKTVQQVNDKDIAHTLTIPSINLNVPIPPSATVEFSFKTPSKPENLMWQCMASCGSGNSGWSGVMSQMGAMRGMFTIKG